MEIKRSAKPNRELADVKIWHCGGCGVVHMAIGKTVVNFSRDEFVSFTEAVVDINYSGWPTRETSVFELMEHDAESYVNAAVH